MFNSESMRLHKEDAKGLTMQDGTFGSIRGVTRVASVYIKSIVSAMMIMKVIRFGCLIYKLAPK
jgi:hypothetical protein